MQQLTMLFTGIIFMQVLSLNAQPCTVSDATGCLCDDNTTSCDLLPDITVAKDLLMSEFFNPEEIGVKYISVSTPNIGDGPLRVIPTDWFVCGTDTIFNPGGASFYCPDGGSAKQMVKQRIYQKQGNDMFYYDRDAGTMTYHPTHSHMHVDDWGYYTIREEIPGVAPLDWPIIGEGRKLGFCLMDFGSCSTFYGHCRDDEDNIITDDLPNSGLGGGMYTCGTVFQGISVGWTDIYYHNIPEMFVNIPANVCNGNYMVVVEVDPKNNFLEKDETNNVIVAPIILTKQSESGDVAVQIDGSIELCNGSSTTLTARFGTNFNWSNGETTQSITVTQPGTYSCSIVTNCGIVNSRPISITTKPTIQLQPQAFQICEPQEVNLQLDGGNAFWYSDSLSNNLVATGNSYTTQIIENSQSYWVQKEIYVPGEAHFNEPKIDDFQYSDINSLDYNGKLLFDVYTPFKLNSFVVHGDTAGLRTFEIRDIEGNLIEDRTVNVPAGISRVNVNFSLLEVGQNYTLGCLEHPGFYRNNIGVFYPYETPEILSIHGSSFGDSFYFYFYDWEIQLLDKTCLSALAEYEIILEGEAVEIDIVDLPVKITTGEILQLVGSPAGGVFSGNGVFFSTFNPSVLNLGIHDITYTYTTPDNCEVSTTESILVYNIDYNFVNYNLGTIAP